MELGPIPVLPAAVGGAIALLTILVGLVLLRRRARGREVVVDGSNVLHWGGGGPQLSTLRAVLDHLAAQGLRPTVIFDANAGYLVSDRYRDDAWFAERLTLPASLVLVVAKGTVADAVILQAARDRRARIVTNDRYRDWADRFPEVEQAGRLVAGRVRRGRVELRP